MSPELAVEDLKELYQQKFWNFSKKVKNKTMFKEGEVY